MRESRRFPAAPPRRAPRIPGPLSPPLLLILLAMLTSGAQGQAPLLPGGGASPEPGSPEALMAEYQELQSLLGRLQVQVIRENADLEARRSAIDELVNAAMTDADSETEAHIARLEVLSEEAMTAQRTQDSATMQALMEEVVELRTALNAAQAAAVAREDVRSEIESFEAALMLKLREADPEAPELAARLDELEEILSAGGPGGG